MITSLNWIVIQRLLVFHQSHKVVLQFIYPVLLRMVVLMLHHRYVLVTLVLKIVHLHKPVLLLGQLFLDYPFVLVSLLLLQKTQILVDLSLLHIWKVLLQLSPHRLTSPLLFYFLDILFGNVQSV